MIDHKIVSMQKSSLPSYDPVAERIIFAQIIAVTFLQKIAVPVSGGTQLFLGFFILLGSIVFGVVSGRLVIRTPLMVAYLLMIAIMVGTQFIGGHDISFLSLILLLFIHSSYGFSLKAGSTRPLIELIFFQKIIFVLCWMAISQFFLQFLIGTDYAFILDGEGLKKFMMQGFNSTNELGYGLQYYKPNAVVLLEPSLLSKLVAISFIIEIIYFKRLWIFGLLLLTTALTFSGSGLLVILILLPFYLIQKRQFAVLILMIVALSTVNFWAPVVGLSRTVERLAEFSVPGTSGYARFVSIFPIIRDHLLVDTKTMLVGYGSGFTENMSNYYHYEIHPPSWGKLWIEYGLVGLLGYLFLMIPAIWSSRHSAYLCMAFTIIMFYDGYLLIPNIHGLIIALLAWPRHTKMDDIIEIADVRTTK